MYSRVDTGGKESFLDKAKQLREERAQSKQNENAIVTVQSVIRRYLAKCRIRREIYKEIDDLLQIPSDLDKEYKPNMVPAVQAFKTIRRFWFLFDPESDRQRFEFLCRYLLYTMGTDNLKFCYVSVALSKDHVLLWIQQLKSILWQCCRYFNILKPEAPRDMKFISYCLVMLVTFTSTNTWKVLKGPAGEALKPGLSQLCNNVMGHLNAKGMYRYLQTLLMKGLARSKPCFKQPALCAIITVALRPLIAAEFSDNLLSLFLLHILSVPAVIHHITTNAQEVLVTLMTYRVFTQSIEFLSNEQSTRIIFNVLEGNYALCLLANLIQLGNSELEGLVENTDKFMHVVTRLLHCCETYVQSKKSNLTHWHPVLGWFSQSTDQNLHEAMPVVVQQLQLLWSLRIIKLLFEPLFVYHDLQQANHPRRSSRKDQQQSQNIFKKAMEKASSGKGLGQKSGKVKIESAVVVSTCTACSLYLSAIQTLSQLRLDILAGLSYGDELLPRLWHLLGDLGPQCGLKSFMDILACNPNDTSHPIFSLLRLACDTACHIIIILDDVEMYEQSKPFTTDSLISISNFLNYFVFRVVWNHIDIKVAAKNELFQSCHALLMVLYARDCRKRYTSDDHWLIKDIKSSSFLSDLERGKKSAQFLLQKVPHIIPHKERVILFRKNVAKEKDVLGLTESVCASPQSTLITVHRSRIIEDGYRQLALLPVNSLKGCVRVKFINEQGLDEAGIDQDGVFKEFLEETISRVFDPALNLFRVTSEQKLYPSPTSYIQDNHLLLFEFVGRMLAKAVYEGIVVEVPFASFFLSQLLGHTSGATYSFIDELPSLDPELYKSLTYVKHYEGDVSDLDLTFSYDEDVMGRLNTHELVPGGRAMVVNNDNKISYVHLMAHFRMHVQIRDQTQAFIRGFKSLINPEWLTMFSTPELQMLISGETADMDLDDLRKHTQYYGGFHNNHRVVTWLWDILEKEFTLQERGGFLKFVTSCSKPPLLGFANLEPPFSIRCVEVADDQDTGDTVGSVLKGFFHIRKRDPVGRLPTSSTCFNLLKLPNYQKKSTLREKLRYAIMNNTGFELS